MRLRQVIILTLFALVAVCSFGFSFFRPNNIQSPLHLPVILSSTQYSQPPDPKFIKSIESHLDNDSNPNINTTNTNSKKPRIAIVTLYDNETQTPTPMGGRYLNVVALSLDNKKTYAEKNGYDFLVDLHMWQDKTRPVAWSKLLAMRERLKEYDWVMWVDIDTLFMNMDIKLESLIDNQYDFIVTKDRNGLNSGVMLMQSSEWSRNFLTECYAQSQFLQELDIYEQRSIIHVLKRPDNEKHVKYLPQKMMNSYSTYHRQFGHQIYSQGDFIIHFAGCRFIVSCKNNADMLMRQHYDLSKTLNGFA